MIVNSGIEAFELFRRRTDQKLVHKQRVPRIFGDDANADAVFKIGAAEQILREQFAAFREGHHVGIERIEMRRGHRLVVVPPDLAFGAGIAHHEFVGGGAAGVLTGERDEGTVFRQMAFAAARRFFIEFRNVQIPVHSFQIAKALLLQPEGLPVRHPKPRGKTAASSAVLRCFRGQTRPAGGLLQRNFKKMVSQKTSYQSTA